MIERLEDRLDIALDALDRIEQWGKAYPIPMFPEPSKDDWKRIADALKAIGLSLDCVSASNMRHVVATVAMMASEALAKIDKT